TARGAPSPVRSWTPWRKRVAPEPGPVDNHRNRLGREGRAGLHSEFESVRNPVYGMSFGRFQGQLVSAIQQWSPPPDDLKPASRTPALNTPENTYRSHDVTAALGQGCRRPRRRYSCAWRGAGPHRRSRRHG